MLTSLLALALAATLPAAPTDTDALVSRVIVQRAELSSHELWPGFAVDEAALALTDGTHTWLHRHPAPPEGFDPVPGVPDLFRREGRHPALTANSTVNLGGVATATVIFDGQTPPGAQQLVALATHELFHVFQDSHHPAWSADESQLFLLPSDDGHLLALRRLESACLRAALLSDDGAAEAARALAYRSERRDRQSDGASGYEHSLELREGLAQYVQSRAQDNEAPPLPPEDGWPAEDHRARAYVTGAAWAVLLDRFSPGWQQQLEANDGGTLTLLLEAALFARNTLPAELDPAERLRHTEAAQRDAAAVSAARAEQLQRFLSLPGPSLVVQVAGGSVLSPQRFDPLNVRLLGDRRVLHGRMLELQRPGARIEVLGRAVLTQGAGIHPLFGGVLELAITGLPAAPVLERNGDRVRLEADGVSAEFDGAQVSTEGSITRVLLP